MTNWQLEDVEKAAEASEDFFIPHASERASKEVGDFVRLHFLLNEPDPDGPRAERMWVEVSERRESQGAVRYRGYLTNEPAFIRDLNVGDIIEFEPRHIAQTIIKESDPRWLPIGELSALVSESVFEPGQRARWAYRESPCDEEDSGWRVFSGVESEEECQDVSKVRVANIGWLTNHDATLFEIFRADVGSAFELDEARQCWVEVDDWKPD